MKKLLFIVSLLSIIQSFNMLPERIKLGDETLRDDKGKMLSSEDITVTNDTDRKLYVGVYRHKNILGSKGAYATIFGDIYGIEPKGSTKLRRPDYEVTFDRYLYFATELTALPGSLMENHPTRQNNIEVGSVKNRFKDSFTITQGMLKNVSNISASPMITNKAEKAIERIALHNSFPRTSDTTANKINYIILSGDKNELTKMGTVHATQTVELNIPQGAKFLAFDKSEEPAKTRNAFLDLQDKSLKRDSLNELVIYPVDAQGKPDIMGQKGLKAATKEVYDKDIEPEL